MAARGRSEPLRRRLRQRFRTHKYHIALEGIDGSGKTTAFQTVGEQLRMAGFDVSTVSYTSKAGVLGPLLRWLYHTDQSERATVLLIRRFRSVQAIMYATNAKLNYLGRKRGPELLFSDRSVLTSYASHWGLLPKWYLEMIEPWYAPDVVIYFSLPPQVASARVQAREPGGYEEDLEALKLFERRYEQVRASLPRRLRRTRIVTIDARQDKPAVAREVLQIILGELSAHDG